MNSFQSKLHIESVKEALWEEILFLLADAARMEQEML